MISTKPRTKISNASIINWFPAVFMMAIIFATSSIPGQVIRDSGFNREAYHVDAHFLLYFLLCVAFFKAVKSTRAALVLTILYALTDEFHQKFVPLRAVSLKDLVTDLAAGLAASFVLWKLQSILPKKLKNWLNS